MKVFEVCMLIIKRRFASFVIYFAIFITLSVAITALTMQQSTQGFSVVRPNFTVINRDVDSPLSEGLITYLREGGTEVLLTDDKSALQDATFFRATDYIVFLPLGFRDQIMAGSTPILENVKTTHTADGYFIDSLVNQYLNQARIYLAAGINPGEAELVSAVLEDLSLRADAEKRQFGESAPLGVYFLTYNQYMCYILLVLVMLCVTNITMVWGALTCECGTCARHFAHVPSDSSRCCAARF